MVNQSINNKYKIIKMKQQKWTGRRRRSFVVQVSLGIAKTLVRFNSI